jgi:hypothetical protein
MALVSPGLQITVTDESQYVPGAVGTVPLIIMATAQDKLPPSGSGTAADTTAARSGKLLAYSSQRELITAMGYPSFQQSAAGTPLHGDERNEYGLMAAYSALGQVNRIYAIRADIDLAALEGTSVRPTGQVANNTHWLDLGESTWGINEWNASSGAFTLKAPLIVTAMADINTGGTYYVPAASVGKIGDYAVVIPGNAVNTSALISYKNSNNAWVRVGTDAWKSSWATITCAPSPALASDTDPWIAAVSPTAAKITINGQEVTIGSTVSSQTLQQVVSAINVASITGISAAAVNNKLEIYADGTAESNGSTPDGKITISSTGGGTPLNAAQLNIVAGTYAGPEMTYGNFAAIPSWRSTDTVPRPSGSVFLKTGATGSGADTVVKRYSSATSTWTTLAVNHYADAIVALAGLDPSGGGNGIAAGTVWADYDPLDDSTAGYKLYARRTSGQTIVSGATLSTAPFTGGDSIIIGSTSIGSPILTNYTVTLSGSGARTPAQFVADVLSANIPEINVTLSNSVITFTHIYGGDIHLVDDIGTPTSDAGFSASTTGTIEFGDTLILSNWEVVSPFSYSTTEPYQAPTDGSLWYYSDPASVDIMVNEIGGWRGYKSTQYGSTDTDARGYVLYDTDPNGVIVTASEPTSQSDGVTDLVPGDLWLDSGDLENYPAVYRYTGSQWTLIDKTDQVSQNGIVFADARWDTDGTSDVISDSLPAITDLLASDYIDQDAPDYRLYPRGILLFNTRRSGFNVKRYVSNKFNSIDYPISSLPTVPGAASTLPAVKNTWQTASGLKNDGSPYAGRQAQRRMVTAAMQSALISNTEIREEQYAFNLIAAPGYPEVIDEMVALNNDRANTAFIVGDTPMRLAPNAIDIANWSNNTNGDGLATADPYLGVWYPSGLAADLQGNEICVPASHMALRTLIRNDNVAYQWFAPAGTRRGLVDNASSIGYINSQTGEFNFDSIRVGLRDTLYENKINPITNLPGVGLVVWGQKTRNPVASSLDRINVARLVNYIRTILANVGNGYLFEPNDKITRDQISNIISGAVNDLIAKRGVYDYLVVCDDSNNTPTRIARNELYVDIAIEPMKDVEFIYIPIRLKNPGDIAAGI